MVRLTPWSSVTSTAAYPPLLVMIRALRSLPLYEVLLGGAVDAADAARDLDGFAVLAERPHAVVAGLVAAEAGG